MIYDDLLKREAEGRTIRVGVSDAGWIGSGFVKQVSNMNGMEITVLADSNIDAARTAFIESGIANEAIVETDKPDTAMDALRSQKRVITGSYSLAAQLEDVDIVADVTPYPATGAETAYACIEYNKDIVLVNIEADVTVGRILKKLAHEADILYTVSSGDEPGCLAELWDFVNAMVFEPIVIGKGKNNPLNSAATPDTVAESARKANKDPFQVASYVDGTKTMFEMTCAANATGCMPMQNGMFGPEATLENVFEVFALEEDGGITKFPGAVDFVQGKSMSGGVFVTVRVEDKRLNDDLKYLGATGAGNYFTFFRPYHLWFLEAPISVARAYLYRQITLVPKDEPIADVMTIAKKNLKPGEFLDDFGGYTFHGLNTRAEEAMSNNALPVGLAPGAKIVKAVEKGAIIEWDHVALDEKSTVVKLRRQQDQL